ncbi:MAG: hypothetical protein R2761_23850 [Acidimicrobiales bacterium]
MVTRTCVPPCVRCRSTLDRANRSLTPRRLLMKLRLGQPVTATDGAFGQLADLIVDPERRTVTHLIVQPHTNRRESRLVPLALASVTADTVMVHRTSDQLGQLPDVAVIELVNLGDQLDYGPDWSTGPQTVVGSPAPLGLSPWSVDEQILVELDKIPLGSCELRRSSRVEDDTGHSLGTLEGIVTTHGALEAIVVRSAHHGGHHYIVVPVTQVADLRSDVVELRTTAEAFHQMDTADDIFGPTDPPSSLARLEHTAGDRVRALSHRLGRMGGGTA